MQRCAERGLRTVVRGEGLRVVSAGDGEAWLCERRRAYVLTHGGDELLGRARLAGRWVAFTSTFAGPVAGQTSVVVASVRTGRVAGGGGATGGQEPDPPAGTERGTAVPALVLAPSGRAAWIGEAYAGTTDAYWRAVRTSTGATLATGLDVDRRSLRLRPGAVRWLQAGTEHTAPL